MTTLIQFVLFLSSIFGLIVSDSQAFKWEHLKIKFGANPFASNVFSSMPTNTGVAEDSDWEQISIRCENNQKFYGFRFIHKNDPGIALLYDKLGTICGIQMNLLKSEVLSPKNKYKYDDVELFQSTSIKGQDVYTLTAYFIEPSRICSTGRGRSDFQREGIGNELFLQTGERLPVNGTGLIKVPLKRSQAIEERWTKNQCLYGMGYHNFYKSEQFERSHCQEIRPVFLLYNSNDDLHGFGFAGFGHATSKRFEHPSEAVIKAILGDNAPQCILDAAKVPGISTVHIYFVKRPYLINCWI